MIKLTHEDHGTHFAMTDLEAKTCERNGWKRAPKTVPKEEPVKRTRRTKEQIEADKANDAATVN